jgi:hypothetical protein
MPALANIGLGMALGDAATKATLYAKFNKDLNDAAKQSI